MPSWLIEELADAVITTLSGQLSPALDAVYARQAAADLAAGRTIDYSAPAPGLAEAGGDYHAGAASTFLRYPSIEVAVPDLRMDNFDLGLTDADVTENLVVVCWEQSAQMPILYRKLSRLAAAICDVLIVPTAIGGANLTSLRAAWRWNPETNERDEITSGALLVLGLESTRSAA